MADAIKRMKHNFGDQDDEKEYEKRDHENEKRKVNTDRASSSSEFVPYKIEQCVEFVVPKLYKTFCPCCKDKTEMEIWDEVKQSILAGPDSEIWKSIHYPDDEDEDDEEEEETRSMNSYEEDLRKEPKIVALKSHCNKFFENVYAVYNPDIEDVQDASEYTCFSSSIPFFDLMKLFYDAENELGHDCGARRFYRENTDDEDRFEGSLIKYIEKFDVFSREGKRRCKEDDAFEDHDCDNGNVEYWLKKGESSWMLEEI